MNTNENIRTTAPEDIIVLGVASIETKGAGGIGETNGVESETGISGE